MASTVAHGVKTLGVVGAGQMGLGIAYVAALRAQIPSVLLCDASPAALDKGVSFFETLLKKDVSKGKIQQADADAARSRLVIVSKLEDFAAGSSSKRTGGSGDGAAADMVIEAATENLSIKQKIFGTLASALPLETILATNTSSISVSKIAASAIPADCKPGSEAAWKSPARALGIHFFNPVPVMPLVELIPALQTSPDVLARAQAFARACGKEITTSKDVPGFVSNRLLMPFINEAVMTLEKEIATKEDIDKTLRLGMNHPMGPLTLADFIGLDTCLSIMETMYRETSDSKYRPAVLLGRMVDAGWYGKKSGKGFYDYPSK